MKLFVPTIGTVLRLTKPWTFILYNENRNQDAAMRLGVDIDPNAKYSWEKYRDGEVKIAKGTALKVERIYIRNGAGDFDSMTFRVVESSDNRIIGKNGKNGIRFWAKLPDCNQIDCSL